MVSSLDTAAGIDEEWLARETNTRNRVAQQKSNEEGYDRAKGTRSDVAFHRT
jgi:hypothetical protein